MADNNFIEQNALWERCKMIKNKLLKVLTGVLTIGALLIIISAKVVEDWCGMIYDISLAVFGSALLALLVAMVEQYQDRKIIKRTVIRQVLKTQREIKKIMSEYAKVLDEWEAQDFREAADKIFGYIDEFYAYNNTLKFENGKWDNYFEREILEIYNNFFYMAGDFRTIGTLLNNNLRNEAYSKYKECREEGKLVVDSITKVLSKEYGKNFANIESIGLL